MSAGVDGVGGWTDGWESLYVCCVCILTVISVFVKVFLFPCFDRYQGHRLRFHRSTDKRLLIKSSVVICKAQYEAQILDCCGGIASVRSYVWSTLYIHFWKERSHWIGGRLGMYRTM